MTTSEALTFSRAELAGISDEPRIDAERLLLHVLKQTESAWLYAHPDHTLTQSEAQGFKDLVAERATGKPLAYILGEWEFYGRPFYVTPDVLIPRPETEHLIEAALSHLTLSLSSLEERDYPFTIVDIGTGSGCIAITLALELSRRGRDSLSSSEEREAKPGEVKIFATDISPAALAVAKRNAQRHGVLNKIEFLEGDMLKPLKGRQIDLIVSNPPYIPTAEVSKARSTLETRGLKFEPRAALDGGPDGHIFVNQIKNAGIPALVETTGGHIVRLLTP